MKINQILSQIHKTINVFGREINNNNQLSTNQVSEKSTVENTIFGKYVKVADGAYLLDSTINDLSYVSANSVLANVSVGKFCSIAQNVQIGLASHPTRNLVSTHPSLYSNNNLGCTIVFRKNKIFDDSIKRTTIGNDVWIGQNVIIPGGISIGNGSIIAAGSVVVKDVPDYAIVGGNPAKLIRYRFSENQITGILQIKWWDWPLDKIVDSVESFSDIEEFLKTNLI